jgi:hypothetical protein
MWSTTLRPCGWIFSSPRCPRQIDLIEAIEGQKKEKAPRKQKPPAARGSGTIADKMHHAPIKDLGKSIALSQKFWFTAELFGKDNAAFETGGEAHRCRRRLEEARIVVRSEVLSKLKKPPARTCSRRSWKLVERRFSNDEALMMDRNTQHH